MSAETYTVEYTLRRMFNDPDTDTIQTEDVDHNVEHVSTLDDAKARITAESLGGVAAMWLDADADPGSYYVVAVVRRHADGLCWEVATAEGDVVEAVHLSPDTCG